MIHLNLDKIRHLKSLCINIIMVMSEVLKEINWKFCLMYINDITFSKSFQQHLQHLTQVFDRLIEANLKLQSPKCLFALPKVPYLGHIISENGISPNPEKISAVSSFPAPKYKKYFKVF